MRFPCLPLLLFAVGSAAGCPKPAATSRTETEAPAGPAWLEDVTAQVNLAFTHDAGPDDPRYFFPRIMGSGGAVLDVDGDGRLDLYLINNGGPSGAKNRLFRQTADGHFRDISAGSGLDVAGWGQGAAIGDVDNDGRVDVLLTEYGATRLFLNLGAGKFREVTREAGVDNPLWGTSAAFLDYDRDGRLDFIVVNYLDYSALKTCGSGGRDDFCGPSAFNGVAARLFRNLGPGPGGHVRFEDATVKAGLSGALGKGLGVLCADFDHDGWPDMFVANDGMANYLWVNRRDGTFKDEAMTRGVAFPAGGQPAANMGIAWGDADGNGLNDLFVTHLIDETHTLWRQEPRGRFQDRTVGAGLTQGWRSTGFGTALVDLDRDGALDAVWVNGGVARKRGTPPGGPFWSAYEQRNQVFANVGGGKFRDISTANPALCQRPAVGRGLIAADIDNDGAVDLIVTETAGPARVLRTVAPGAGHWLAVRALLPQAGGRDAYGAEITARAGGKSYPRLINPGYSYCCSNDPRAHFGLGAADRVDELSVVWPDGRTELFPGGNVDREITLRQGEGRPAK